VIVLLIRELPMAVATDDNKILVVLLPAEVMQLKAEGVSLGTPDTDRVSRTQAPVLLLEARVVI
jgi:hypothetical protein